MRTTLFLLSTFLFCGNHIFAQAPPPGGGGGIGPAWGDEYHNFILFIDSYTGDDTIGNGEIWSEAEYELFAPLPYSEVQLTVFIHETGFWDKSYVDSAFVPSFGPHSGDLSRYHFTPMPGGLVGPFSGSSVLTTGIDYSALLDQVSIHKPTVARGFKGNFSKARAVTNPDGGFDMRIRCRVENPLENEVEVKFFLMDSGMMWSEMPETLTIETNRTVEDTLQLTKRQNGQLGDGSTTVRLEFYDKETGDPVGDPVQGAIHLDD